MSKQKIIGIFGCEQTDLCIYLASILENMKNSVLVIDNSFEQKMRFCIPRPNEKMNAHHRRSPITWIPTAYFAMGLPFVFLNMVTVLMFKGLGVEDKLITFWTSLILLPWTLKPLWSPFLELFKTKKFFVIATQLITGITFGLVAFSLQLPHFFSIAIGLLAVIAFSGATHDIACDGVYMSELSTSDQAKYIGWQGAFYNIAKIVATGGLVYLAGYLIEMYSAGATDGVAVLSANRKSWMIILAAMCVVVAIAIAMILALVAVIVVV